jgi:membrane protein YdbS with pleckstrin-like domain
MSDTVSHETASADLSEEWEGISPRHRLDEWLTMSSVFALMAIGVGVSMVIPDFLPWMPRWALFLALGVLWLTSMVMVPFRVRAMKYRLRADDFVYRRGIIFQRQVAVPYGRLQLVDVTRGPLARVLGLSELRLVTAASTSGVVIPGIVRDRALSLRDQLIAVAETRRAGL